LLICILHNILYNKCVFLISINHHRLFNLIGSCGNPQFVTKSDRSVCKPRDLQPQVVGSLVETSSL
jgi:hypothetical protein